MSGGALRGPITTHILDLALGRPAAGVQVRLYLRDGASHWRDLGVGETDGDGRIQNLLAAGWELEVGTYRLEFVVGPYFAARQQPSFYPEISLVFAVEDPRQHYHVPLLLSPFGYSTYRGS